ncbi:hypothetical protein DFH06DRAFT_1343841 [Mycena polygramma]|nr:hypothetical protein DFH06DRAFT_1343841 [Mycena polygramma]
MDDTILNDDEEDQRLATEWIPEDWISCGKKYHDVPAVVKAARRNLLKIPPSFIRHVPPKTLSIASLLALDLPLLTEPGIGPMDDDAERFCDLLPSADLEDVLPFLCVPNRAELHQLLGDLGQVWFDGKQSFRTWVNPDVVCPFWVAREGFP